MECAFARLSKNPINYHSEGSRVPLARLPDWARSKYSFHHITHVVTHTHPHRVQREGINGHLGDPNSALNYIYCTDVSL